MAISQTICIVSAELLAAKKHIEKSKQRYG